MPQLAAIYYDSDADLDKIRRKRISLVGYGNQGRAQALNLRDSGCEVGVGLYDGSPSRTVAEHDGFTVQTVAEASAWGDVISILLADQLHRSVFEESIRSHLTPGKLLLVAHGFSIHFGQLVPPPQVDVGLVAPVGPGAVLRESYVEGSGIPAVIAVHQNVTGEAHHLILSYAAALGCTRAGVIGTTVREETETDLFGEQVVLCGGIPALIAAAYRVLVEAGFQSEMAYFECVHQVKLIVDLIYQGGMARMHEAISDTAEFGAYLTGPRIVDEHVSSGMRDVLRDIQDGTFARRWVDEYESGGETVAAQRRAEQASDLEDVGRRLRAMMPWLER
jgi:ketol-acid reductoisomerase